MVRVPPFAPEVPVLLQHHLDHLVGGSAISIEVVKERGYRSVLGKEELEDTGFSPLQRRPVGIIVPLQGPDDSLVGYQYRPDNPCAVIPKGKAIKYEMPAGASLRLDVPCRCRSMLKDPNVPSGSQKRLRRPMPWPLGDSALVNICGVWGFRGKNEMGSVAFLADWDYVALNGRTVYLAFDSDILTKREVKAALERLSEHLRHKGSLVHVIRLPQNGADKMGIDDFLLTHSVQDVVVLAEPVEAEREEPQPEVRLCLVLSSLMGLSGRC